MTTPTTIPTMDRKGIGSIIDSVRNISDLMSLKFHSVLIQTWEALNKPPYFKMYFPLIGTIVFVADPAMADNIVRMKDGVTEKSRLMTQGLRGEEGPIGTYGLIGLPTGDIGPTGVTYKDIQQHITPAFSVKAIQRYTEGMRQDALDLVQEIPKGVEIDLVAYINEMVLKSAAGSLLSTTLTPGIESTRVQEFLKRGAQAGGIGGLLEKDWQQELLQRIRGLAPDKVPDFDAYLEDREWLFDTVIGQIFFTKVAQIKSIGIEKYEVKDMLDNLIVELLKAQELDPIKYTDDVVKEVAESTIATFLVAGLDTSAAHETTVFNYILNPQNSQVLKNIKEELNLVLGGRLPTYEDLKKLKYLEAVMIYILTIYPPAFIIPREVAGDDMVVGGETLKKGDQIFAALQLVHRTLIPELEDVGPEFFLDENNKKKYYHQLLTFGKGARSCIGATFTHEEVMMHLSTLLQNLDINLVNSGSEVSGLTPLSSTDTLRVIVQKIDNALREN